MYDNSKILEFLGWLAKKNYHLRHNWITDKLIKNLFYYLLVMMVGLSGESELLEINTSISQIKFIL
jgi:hypothetical protein